MPRRSAIVTKLRAFVALWGLAFVVLLALPAEAGADWEYYYPSPAWYSAGEGHGSRYDDNFCFRWNDNYFSKSHVAKGTIAWINSSGGWRYSVVDSYETVMWYTIPDINWVKKLYAKNSSTIGYSSTTQGYHYHYSCV
jgi:hypothetical protein